MIHRRIGLGRLLGFVSAKGERLRNPHPFLRRLAWNPFVVAVPLAYLGYTAYLGEFPVGRTAGAAFVAFWFGLSVFDTISGHRLLDWLYSDEDEETGGG